MNILGQIYPDGPPIWNIEFRLFFLDDVTLVSLWRPLWLLIFNKKRIDGHKWTFWFCFWVTYLFRRLCMWEQCGQHFGLGIKLWVVFLVSEFYLWWFFDIYIVFLVLIRHEILFLILYYFNIWRRKHCIQSIYIYDTGIFEKIILLLFSDWKYCFHVQKFSNGRGK